MTTQEAVVKAIREIAMAAVLLGCIWGIVEVLTSMTSP